MRSYISRSDNQGYNKMFKYATSHLRHPGRILAFFAVARETMGLYRDLPFTANAETTVRCCPLSQFHSIRCRESFSSDRPAFLCDRFGLSY